MKNYLDAINKTKLFSPEEVSLDFFLDDLFSTIRNTQKIYLIGNGASCSMASHYAVDFTKNIGIPAESLNDGALLTCFINDFNFKDSYKEMLKRKINLDENNLLIAISSSGNSENIVEAVDYAYNWRLPCFTLTGFSEDNAMQGYSIDHKLYVPAQSYGQVEVAHNFWLHYIIDKYKDEL